MAEWKEEEVLALPIEMEPELSLGDNRYKPDTWQLANDVEDEMLGHIDRKRACERICNGEDDGFGLSEELRFVVRLIFHGFHEYFDLMQRQNQGGFSIVRLYQIMRSIGFHDVGIKRVIKKLFRKEIIFKKNIEKYYIMKVRRKLISKEEGEIKMTKNGNGKRDRLRQLDMAEMKSVAKELGCEIKGKRKEDVAKELIDHIGKIPEDEPLGDSVVSWYNVAGRLYDGTAQTLEEARKKEMDEKQANAETEKVEIETEGVDAEKAEVEVEKAEAEEEVESEAAKTESEDVEVASESVEEAEVEKKEGKEEKSEEDEFGLNKGTKISLLANSLKKKPLTMAEVRELPWNKAKISYYGNFKKLEDKGIAKKDQEGRMSVG